MKSVRHIITAAFTAASLGIAFAPAAHAGCLPGTAGESKQPGAPKLEEARYLAHADDHDNAGEAAIVGFWHVQLIVGEDVVDDAFVQWHADGTEIMNSSRPPITSSFCLGVWKRTGPRSYHLKHLAKSWGPDGLTPVGPAVILEDVALALSANSYTGTFSLTQYDLDGNVISPDPAHGVPAVTIYGTIRAVRITPN
jgi:hypothetical protein